MASQPKSLSDDDKPVLRLIKGEIELPKGRQNIIMAFAKALGLGGVQKVVVEVGKPIKVWRNVDEAVANALAASPGQGEEVTSGDPMEKIRNSPMKEFSSSKGDDPLFYLHKAFSAALADECRPGFIVASSKAIFGLPLETTDVLFGIPLFVNGELPPYVAILACQKEDDESLGFSLRLEFPRPDVKKGGKK